MEQVVLALNAGSCTLKAAAWRFRREAAPYMRCRIELDSGVVHGEGDWPQDLQAEGGDLLDAAVQLVGRLNDDHQEITAVVHCLPQGGSETGPRRVDEALLEHLEKLGAACPLQQAPVLELIDYLRQLWPGLPQWVVFDSAFHLGQPLLSSDFALPAALRHTGVRAGGYHGLSCQQVLHELSLTVPALADARLLVLHLSRSVSLTAIHQGRSVACSMGFSPVDGLPMGTRAGSIDPGVLLYLLETGWSRSRLTDLLYHQSGLLGLSGNSPDWRVLLASPDDNAGFAIDYACDRIARQVAALGSALQGLDALVFTGSAGASLPLLREKILRRLEWLGLRVDAAANAAGAACISRPDSVAAVHVLATDEETEMCRQVLPYLAVPLLSVAS